MALHYIGASILILASAWLWMEEIGGSHRRPGLWTFVVFIAGAAWYGAVQLFVVFRRLRRL